MTEGTGVPRACGVERFEQKLAEVKQLCQQKYDQEVDECSLWFNDADGTAWTQTSGTGVARDLRVERLEQMLSVVKDFYSEKYGRDVDTEYYADGTAWKVTEGTGVPRDCRVKMLKSQSAQRQSKCGSRVSHPEIGLVSGWQQDGGPPAYWWVDHYPHLAAKNLGMVRELNDSKGGGLDRLFLPNSCFSEQNVHVESVV